MVDKSFFVANVGGYSDNAVQLEAEMCDNGKVRISILSTGRVSKKLFEWTVSEEEVESLQNLFIFLKNELGIRRLNESLAEKEKRELENGNEQNQIL